MPIGLGPCAATLGLVCASSQVASGTAAGPHIDSFSLLDCFSRFQAASGMLVLAGVGAGDVSPTATADMVPSCS